MINVYPTRIEAADENQRVLFALQMEDAHCCTIEVKNPLVLSKSNLEQVLTAVRRGVQMLGLED
jgi:hypothetical protein